MPRLWIRWGAWGPAITDGRSIAQFPSIEDQIDFIISGTNASEPYGVNGCCQAQRADDACHDPNSNKGILY